MKKILIIFAGVLLIISGLFMLLFLLSPRPLGIYPILSVISSPILIFSGLKLFSFKKTGQKLAILSYGIVLLQALYYNITGYLLALYLSYSGDKPNPYSITNIIDYFRTGVAIIPIIPFIIAIFFITVLAFSKEQFK